MSVADGLLNVTGKLKFSALSNSSIFNRYHWCIIIIFNSSIAVSVVDPTVPVMVIATVKVSSILIIVSAVVPVLAVQL
jgi:hypothetical protein